MNKIPEKKLRLKNSSLVRIGKKSIRKAYRIKNKSKLPIGQIFEDALDLYDDSYVKGLNVIITKEQFDEINNSLNK